jgi:hypothetical protein
MAKLSFEEQRSLTHGEFWIPEEERVVYQQALRKLNQVALPYVVSGLYAMYEYTGIYRKTKDLDLFVEPGNVVSAARTLKEEGFTVRLEDAHWLAKAFKNEKQIDLIYGMGNGLALIDAAWYRHSRAGILAATQVRVAPPEELLWHRLYVSERHRHDMADVLHLIVCRGDELNWGRLLRRLHQHFRLLLAHIHLFDFVYPGHRGRIPDEVREQLHELAAESNEDVGDPDVCQGTLISRFSFSIDVNEWGFRDLRKEATIATRSLPIIKEIVESDVWDH